MRLLNIYNFAFQDFASEWTRPPYAILSHRWQANEPLLQDILSGRHDSTTDKLRGFADYVRQHFPYIRWVWMDSCCIKQDDSVERSESVNLMFDWYRHSVVCVAYLADVHDPLDRLALCGSVWFRRGWTLQEMLASKVLILVKSSWQAIGHKGEVSNLAQCVPVGPNIELVLSIVSNVPEAVLHDFETCQALSTKEKLNWMRGRRTTKQEDMFYALYGIFGVAPGVNYGEKRVGARRRLLDAIAAKELQSEAPSSTNGSGSYCMKFSALAPERLNASQREELMVMFQLAMEYDKTGQTEEAIHLLHIVVDRCRRLCGNETEYKVAALDYLGQLYYKIGRDHDACQLYKHMLDIRKQTNGATHAKTLTVMHRLSAILLKLGSYVAARDIMASIVAVRQEKFGAEHAETLRAVSCLTSLQSLINTATQSARDEGQLNSGRPAS